MTTAFVTVGQGAGLRAYAPAGKAEPGGPGLVVLQEIYGVNEEVRRVADFYARRGFRVLAPDLLWRAGSGLTFDYSERDAAREAIGRLAAADIIADIRLAGQELRRQGGANAKVGILAFGWGGQYALAAAQGTEFDAVSAYYPGNLASHVSTAQAVHAPLQLHFSARDSRTPLELRTAFRQGLAQRDDVEIYTYAEPDHGFANRGRPEFHAGAADLADARTLAFLSSSLIPARAATSA